MTSDSKIRWRLLSASNVAREWTVAAIRENPDCEVVSVLSTDAVRAESFRVEFGLKRAETDLGKFL